MFIFRPNLGEEEQKTLVEELERILQDNQSQINSSQIFGRRNLAYEIKKFKEGMYYLITFTSSTGDVVNKLKKACNINENILRTLIVKRGRDTTR
jgi:small subunit ribosomal protein S6